MGFFGGFLFDGRSWTEAGRGAGTVPWLHVDIHDSDFTVVTYRPAGPGTGTAFLGFTPRMYFGQPDAGPPTDAPREAAGLAAWWAARQDGATDADRDAMAAALLPFLATDDEPVDDDDDDDDDDRSPFVEDETDDFLAVLGLPPFRD